MERRCPACNQPITFPIGSHLKSCPVGQGWLFVNSKGELERRDNRNKPVRVINLDRLNDTQVRAFRAAWKSNVRLKEFARLLYPGRPRGYLIAAQKLYGMALFKLSGRSAHFETLYRQLPKFAQWRTHFPNVPGAVIRGKKFRKTPPKRR